MPRGAVPVRSSCRAGDEAERQVGATDSARIDPIFGTLTARIELMGQAKTATVGEELPTFQRTTDAENWNRFAAVNYEFVPHLDDEGGRKAGYPSAFGMGNLQWSYLHNLLRNWLGDD